MCVLPQVTEQCLLKQLESAASVYLSPLYRFELTPTELAQLRGVARSTIYRQAQWLRHQLHRLTLQHTHIVRLTAENQSLRTRLQQLEALHAPYSSGHWTKVDPEKLALTTLELAARHNSVSDIQAILQVAFDLPKPPSDGTITNIIKQGAALAEKILDSVQYHFPLDAIELDELFHAQSPILAALEPYSMSLLFLHQLGDCKASTWKFGFDLLDADLPPLLVHDCSQQGKALVTRLGKISQLCVWHRLREIGRELRPDLDKSYQRALEDLDEDRWSQLEQLDSSLGQLAQLTHSLDPYRFSVRRFELAKQELLDWCAQIRQQLKALGLACPSLRGLVKDVDKYLAHLKQWDRLAEQVEPIEGSGDFDGFLLVHALAEVHLREQSLVRVYEERGESRAYRMEQSFFLDACERLREAQSKVQNAGTIEEKFRLLVGNQVRTSSRVEALNRRLRGFTDAKRQVTERQLLLMQLHHNTTTFTADAKRAGKSPWEWLELDVAGLEDGFVGVLREASRAAGVVWPSVWALKP